MSDPIARLNAALKGRYTTERELGEGTRPRCNWQTTSSTSAPLKCRTAMQPARVLIDYRMSGSRSSLGRIWTPNALSDIETSR